MRRALWLACDLAREGPSPGRAAAVLVYPALLLPLQSGLIDGALSGTGVIPGWLGLRLSMTLAALPCGIAALGVTLEAFFPRRIRGDIEPILATPLTERELIAACALPGWLLAVLAPLTTHLLALAGYALGAGRLPEAAASQYAWSVLATAVAMVWITAAVTRAMFAARSLGAAMAWGMAGFLPAAATDLLCAVAHFFMPQAAWAVLGLSLAAAVATLRWCAGAARREQLLLPA